MALLYALQPYAQAESIPVHHMEGTVHGFLALRSKEGRVLAMGDLFQVVHGDRVTSRLLCRFKDGSVDDETAVFSQHGNFQVITDHHVQKGPHFRIRWISRSTFAAARSRSAPPERMARRRSRVDILICRRT